MRLTRSIVLLFCIGLIFQSAKLLGQQRSGTDICTYLGGRADKNFLGSGNMALQVEANKTRVLFLQQWNESGLCDWTSGSIAGWYPDRIEMKDAMPSTAAKFSHQPVTRTLFIARTDVAGMELIWKNTSDKEITVDASFSGKFPKEAQLIPSSDNGTLIAMNRYSSKIDQPVFYLLGAAELKGKLHTNANEYNLIYQLHLKPGETKSLTLLLHIGTDKTKGQNILDQLSTNQSVKEIVRRQWNNWFNTAFPVFDCSDAYTKKLYYYRCW